MLNIARIPLVTAGLGFAMVAGTIALAEDNSSATTPKTSLSPLQREGVANPPVGQSSTEINPSNLPKTEAGPTEQQSKAPVVDPHANTPTPATDPAAAEKTGAQGANTQSAGPQEWPAPQRYEAGSRTNGNASPGKGGASLGVNVVGSESGQGVVVARIRPGTPAEQMGLRPRDRILSLNGQPVGSVDEFIAAIRGMGAGDQIQLSIDRSGNTRDLGGRLAASRETIVIGDGTVGNIVGRARELIGRERNARLGENYRASGENMQTSYEDGSQNGRQVSGDLEARLNRVEQQLSQLTRELAELRTANHSTSTSGPALAEPSAVGQPETRAPGALQSTPAEPPSVLQAPSR